MLAPRATLLINLLILFLQAWIINCNQRKTRSSHYMDTNNLYQWLIQIETIVIPIMRTLRPSKKNQIVTKQQPAPSSTVIKSSGILPMSGKSDIGQHISPITKPGQQEIFVLWNKIKQVNKIKQEIKHDILLQGSFLY